MHQNDWDALLVKEPLTGRLYVRTFQQSFSPNDAAKMISTVQVAGYGNVFGNQ
jgi:hypothetical protein